MLLYPNAINNLMAPQNIDSIIFIENNEIIDCFSYNDAIKYSNLFLINLKGLTDLCYRCPTNNAIYKKYDQHAIKRKFLEIRNLFNLHIAQTENKLTYDRSHFDTWGILYVQSNDAINEFRQTILQTKLACSHIIPIRIPQHVNIFDPLDDAKQRLNYCSKQQQFNIIDNNVTLLENLNHDIDIISLLMHGVFLTMPIDKQNIDNTIHWDLAQTDVFDDNTLKSSDMDYINNSNISELCDEYMSSIYTESSLLPNYNLSLLLTLIKKYNLLDEFDKYIDQSNPNNLYNNDMRLLVKSWLDVIFKQKQITNIINNNFNLNTTIETALSDFKNNNAKSPIILGRHNISRTILYSNKNLNLFPTYFNTHFNVFNAQELLNTIDL